MIDINKSNYIKSPPFLQLSFNSLSSWILPYNSTITYPTGTPTSHHTKLYRILPKPAYTIRIDSESRERYWENNQNTRRHSQDLKQTGSCSNTILDHHIPFLSVITTPPSVSYCSFVLLHPIIFSTPFNSPHPPFLEY